MSGALKPYKPRRFDLDVLYTLFDKFPGSPLGSLIVAALLYRRARHSTALGCSFFDYLALNKKLALFLAWVALKTSNRALSRYVTNHGWAADKPRWSSGREIVVITGAAGGIGAEIVKRLLKRTNKVAIIDLVPPNYPTGPARFYKGDVSDPAVMHDIANKIRSELGDPTIVIANAGIAHGKKIVDCTPDNFLHVLKVNALGPFILFHEFLPAIIKQNHGHFVTVGSSASYISIAQLCDYTTSKSGVLGLHETLGQELYYRYNAPRVRTTFVCPTKVRTQLGEGLVDNEMQFVAPTIWPEEVGEAVVKQIDSGLSGHIMQPLHARLLLPKVRGFPEWYPWLVHALGKTHKTTTDDSGESAWKNFRLSKQEMGFK